MGKALPAPWSSQDIGNPGPGNTYEFDPCAEPPAFTIVAGAANNQLSSDNIAYIQQQLCGDFQATVKVEGITANGFAGLLARESGAAGSKEVGMYTNLQNLIRWETRTVTGANKTVNFYNKPLPYWLRLVRQSGWFLGYYSFDGVNFQIVAAQPLSLNACLEVGFGAFTNIPGSPAVAVFSNVTVSGGVLPVVTAPIGQEVEPGAAVRTLSLYPNPAQGMVTLTRTRSSELLLGEATYSNQKIGGTVRLRNELGQILETRQLDEPLERLEWDISQLRPGLYFMEVLEEGQAPQVLRFVKAE
ncbi:MAG: T9SS type A sorting domain-containing protein [Lewinellaceae bacterium]|nr:T9SS type A sorting domain-containing protein [Lewinellaceae bacterium]